ncbi:MAG: bifunctional ADP-dependent NAD(P)H-hydrate dehydratase/NAD(P)H-hydrate epimerase, partial [Clostridiales bacterium]|nr:bifunctional ADP-dependent NAD(P)H-hydrate dehydratase/NAD(P)H-hydrate epimerase [Clostridiales bacterium]
MKKYLTQTAEEIEALLPPRPCDSHKGKNGHALLAVGSARYRGAALLATRACLRGGSGLTTVVTPEPVWQAFTALPEAVCLSTGTEDWNEIACAVASRELGGKQAVLIGCGVGMGTVLPLIADVLATQLPLVLDADALNQLAEGVRGTEGVRG